MISIQKVEYSNNILMLSSTGELKNDDDLHSYFEATLELYHHHNPLYLVLDETKVVNRLGLMANFGFADHLVESMLLLKLKKMAIISRESDFDNNQKFANFLNAKELNVKIFLNKDEANKWIEI